MGRPRITRMERRKIIINNLFRDLNDSEIVLINITLKSDRINNTDIIKVPGRVGVPIKNIETIIGKDIIISIEKKYLREFNLETIIGSEFEILKS